MKIFRLSLVTFLSLSLSYLSIANHHFNKSQTLEIIQAEIAKKDEMNLLTIHVQLEMIAQELHKKWDLELFSSTLKFYPPIFKKIDHYATVEAIATLYEQHKIQIDMMVKKVLEQKDQEEFHRRLKLALEVRMQGNG